MAEYNFNNTITDKLLLATKATILRNIKSNLGATGIIEETKRDIIFDFGDTQDNEGLAQLGGIDKIVNITFLPTNYINHFGEEATTPNVELEIATISLNARKNIVKTKIINQKGTIKEIVGQDDYSVTISGILIGQYGHPTIQDLQRAKPVQKMKELIEISEARISVDVLSKYLNNFLIKKLVIESFSFPQNLESSNLQAFTLTCTSDSDDLTIL